MSKENVELVRGAWEASLAEDWPAVLATLDPEAEIRDFDVPDADVNRGHDGFFAWLGRWNEAWASWRVEGLDIQPVGDDWVIALFEMKATGGHSGLELDRKDAIVYRIENGLIVYQAYFNDQKQAFDAARSGEQAHD